MQESPQISLRACQETTHTYFAHFLKPACVLIIPILPRSTSPSPILLSLFTLCVFIVCISVLLLMLLSGLHCTSLWHLLRFLHRIPGMVYSIALDLLRARTDTMGQFVCPG